MQLLQHFKELTVRPKNAQELKGLILQLAIQGKLTANWRTEKPNLEPAWKLLNRIQKEKDQRIKDKTLRKEKPIPQITQEESPYILPEKWVWCRMLDFCYLITDGAHHTPKYVENGVPFLSVKNLSKGLLDFSDTKFIEYETHLQLIKRCNPEYGDILLTKIGTTGIAKVIDTKKDFSIFVSVALLKIAKNELFPEFVEYCINSPFIKNQSSEGTEGVGNKNLVLRKIKAFMIPLPPLEEQKEIVKVVETLFKEVEQLEQLTVNRISLKVDFVTSALSKLTTNNTQKEWAFLQKHFQNFFDETTNIKKLRETILQLAVQGKLTRSWRESHPELVSGFHHACELLKRIQKEKAHLVKEKKIKKEKPLPPITKEEFPYEIPEGWVWCPMGEIAEKLGAGSTPSGGKSAYVDEGIMFFRSQNIYNDYLKLEQVAYITDSIHEKMKGTKVKPKDILLNITGGSIGRCALIPDNFGTANVSQHVAIVRLVEEETRQYIHQFIISPGFQDRIMDVQVGVSREGLSMTKLKLFPTPLPPLEEQKAIVQKVNALMGLCDALEQQVEQSQEQSEQLMQSCLREVFEGKKEVCV